MMPGFAWLRLLQLSLVTALKKISYLLNN